MQHNRACYFSSPVRRPHVFLLAQSSSLIIIVDEYVFISFAHLRASDQRPMALQRSNALIRKKNGLIKILNIAQSLVFAKKMEKTSYLLYFFS